MPPTRPLGLSILAALAFLSASLTVVLVATVGNGDLLGAAVGAAFAVGYFVTGYGLWLLRPWAWPLAMTVWVLGVLEALLLLTEGSINSTLIVGPIVLAYLLQPGIRDLFRR